MFSQQIQTNGQRERSTNRQESSNRTRTLLSERSSDELRLASPYTIYIKNEKNGSYTWLSYSLGRPRNVVWGIVKSNGPIRVEFGCRWESFAVLSRMLENREAGGFILTSTIASDKITHFVAYPLIEAYQQQSDLQLGSYYWTVEEINAMFMDEFLRRDVYNEVTGNVSVKDLEESGHAIATRLQKSPNRVQFKQTPIPEEVVRAVHDFVEHNPTLSTTSLPKECPTYEDCLMDPTDSSCGLYYGIDVL